jgi:hypothetical protein
MCYTPYITCPQRLLTWQHTALLIPVDCALVTLGAKPAAQTNGCMPSKSMFVSAHVACCTCGGGGSDGAGKGDTLNGCGRRASNMRDTQQQSSAAIALRGLSTRSCNKETILNLRVVAGGLLQGRSKHKAHRSFGCSFCRDLTADYALQTARHGFCMPFDVLRWQCQGCCKGGKFCQAGR